MNNESLLTTLIRLNGGSARALTQRNELPKLEDSLIYIKANVRHALKLLGSTEAW